MIIAKREVIQLQPVSLGSPPRIRLLQSEKKNQQSRLSLERQFDNFDPILSNDNNKNGLLKSHLFNFTKSG